MIQPVYTVSDFVAMCNQVLDVSFGQVQIIGEVSQFRVSKNRWIYCDLKDNHATIGLWGSVHVLPGPIADGMQLLVYGNPQMHPKFGFSITIQSMGFVGEGTIKKAAQLLEIQLEKEGLFAKDRKRLLPYPPTKIGLITSAESAAYADFIKIITNRWPILSVYLYDVQVQGEGAPTQIVAAIEQLNQYAEPLDTLVIIRGGGSLEDLQTFNSEQVIRAIASSRIPTLVAIGHETDLSLAERAADCRASTPSNAAELLVPDKLYERKELYRFKHDLDFITERQQSEAEQELLTTTNHLNEIVDTTIAIEHDSVFSKKAIIEALNPYAVLRRGYVIVRQHGTVISSVKKLAPGSIEIQFKDGIKKGTMRYV